MKLNFQCASGPGRNSWFIWPHAELPPDHLLAAECIKWRSEEPDLQHEVDKVIQLARSRISAAMHAPWERFSFEAWANAHDLVTTRLNDQAVYPSPTTQAAWCAWLARAAHPTSGDSNG